MLTAILMAGCISCTDRSPTGLANAPETGDFRMSPVVSCTVDVQAVTVVCREEAVPDGDAPSLAILGRSHIRMASTNAGYDSVARVFSFDATAQNLLAKAVGTPDGTTTTGLKVFFETGPTPAYHVPGDTGTVTVPNGDGTGNFTGANQPYHLYDTILQPNAVSAPKHWEFSMARTVKSFAFTVRVFAATPGEPRVPEDVPDGVPAWVYAPSNLATDNAPDMAGQFPRDVLFVRFAPGTSLEERQAAIEYVGGRVVGGSRIADEYAVQVADQATSRALFSAIRKLQALPHVVTARPDPLLSPLYLAPTDDSAGWKPSDYSLSPDTVSGTNWNYERIAAPWAWGCTVGADTTRVAVIDQGFHAVSDIQRNTAGGVPRFGQFNPDSMDHGTSVASLLAANGNDSTQMAGVMWRAHLELYEVSNASGNINLTSVRDAYLAATVNNASVVNLSAGLNWNRMFHRLPHSTYIDSVNNRARDSALAAQVHRSLRDAVRNGDALADTLPHLRPLIVIASSNDGIDASWSGVANIATDFSDRVLVVGASDINDTRASFSNHNGGAVPAVYTAAPALVSVMAPGQDVPVLNGRGRLVSASGTSFAAPQVSGVAGLLRAMDSRLDAAQLRSLVLEGATRGGRTVGGLPLLHAYESLKASAERMGAPLCGNRLWLSGGQVRAQRGAGTQDLFAVPGDAEWLGGMHGGNVRVWDPNALDDRIFRWSRSGWAEVLGADPDYGALYGDPGPGLRSTWGTSHDDTLTVVMEESPTNVLVSLRTAGTGAERFLATLPLSPGLGPDSLCVLRTKGGSCVGKVPATIVIAGRSSAGFSSRGEQLLVSTYTQTFEKSLEGDWYDCPMQPETPFEDRYQCQDYRVDMLPTQGRLYRIIGIATGSPTVSHVAVEAGGSLVDLVFADNLPRPGNPRELYVGREVRSGTSVLRWHGEGEDTLPPTKNAPGWVVAVDGAEERYSQTCTGTFRDLHTLAVLQTTPACVSIGGSFAPDRIAASKAGGQVVPRDFPRVRPARRGTVRRH